MNSVTVIIPAYNAEVCLSRCLESIFNQTHRPKQVIVVNDGSTDKTKGIALSFENSIEYIENENLGPGASRNEGLKVARGDYVAFLDADDYWLPDFLLKCVSFLEKHPDAVAVSTGQIHKLWGHGEIIRPLLILSPDCPRTPFIIEKFFTFWAEQNHIVTGSAVIRRSVVEEAGYQRTDFRVFEDLEYWGYLATFGNWGFISEILWVGDPTPAAVNQGWIKKHRRRWQNLPNLKRWESRILPRLKIDDMDGFQRVKNRIATSLAHQNILAGNYEEAKRIIFQLEGIHSRSIIMQLLQAGLKGGAVGWFLVCIMIRMRERIKACAVFFSKQRFLKNI